MNAFTFARPIYGQSARFDAPRALTEDELFKLAPSIFATVAHDSRSERFQPIPTIEIVRGLAKEGFSVVGAKQSRTRVPGKEDFTKHALRIRKIDTDKPYAVGDVLPEMILQNANDGTSAYNLMCALFRIRCLNSLVTHHQTLESTKVRHSGKPADVMGTVIEGTFTVIDEARRALAYPDLWQGVKLAQEERQFFAQAVHEARFGEEAETGLGAAIQPMRLLAPRRPDDQGSDLWTTFNVAQENVIRGGLKGITRTHDERGRVVARRTSMREVKGIDQDIKLNRALFALAEKMAEFHGVKLAA